MPGASPSGPLDASSTVRGLINTLAQTIGGVKTFLGTIIASAGVQTASLFNTNGGSASDVMVKVGTSTANASVNALAKILSLRTGLGGTEVEKAYFRGSDGAYFGSYIFLPSDGSGWLDLGLCRQFGNNASGNIFYQFNSGASVIGLNTSTGRIDQSGTDSTGSPGIATINKPTGKSAIAIGAATVRITNSLVTAASRVIITPHARDATCKEIIAVPGAGFFDVSGTANATAALPFSWEVSNIL